MKENTHLNITMPFRDRLSRMIRKSGSSGSSDSSGDHSSDGHAEPYKVSSNTSASAPFPLTHYRFAKKPNWRPNPSSTTHDDDVRSFSPTRKPSPKRSAKSAAKRAHPSERPLTEQNLRHQEILGTFTMKFGRSRALSRGARSGFSGISPCNSRPASVDLQDLDDEELYGQSRVRSLVDGPAEKEGAADEDS